MCKLRVDGFISDERDVNDLQQSKIHASFIDCMSIGSRNMLKKPNVAAAQFF